MKSELFKKIRMEKNHTQLEVNAKPSILAWLELSMFSKHRAARHMLKKIKNIYIILIKVHFFTCI